MTRRPVVLLRSLAGLPARAGLFLVRGYQRFVSPALPSSCRYHPSCSEYAYLAIGEWGLVRGGLLAAWRVLRCNPWSPGGFDMPPRRGAHARAATGASPEAGRLPAAPTRTPSPRATGAPCTGRHVVTHGS